MKTIILFLALATEVLAAEAPQPETLREMELRKALIESQITIIRLNYNNLQQELQKLDAELEKKRQAQGVNPAK